MIRKAFLVRASLLIAVLAVIALLGFGYVGSRAISQNRHDDDVIIAQTKLQLDEARAQIDTLRRSIRPMNSAGAADLQRIERLMLALPGSRIDRVELNDGKIQNLQLLVSTFDQARTAAAAFPHGRVSIQPSCESCGQPSWAVAIDDFDATRLVAAPTIPLPSDRAPMPIPVLPAPQLHGAQAAPVLQ